MQKLARRADVCSSRARLVPGGSKYVNRISNGRFLPKAQISRAGLNPAFRYRHHAGVTDAVILYLGTRIRCRLPSSSLSQL